MRWLSPPIASGKQFLWVDHAAGETGEWTLLHLGVPADHIFPGLIPAEMVARLQCCGNESAN